MDSVRPADQSLPFLSWHTESSRISPRYLRSFLFNQFPMCVWCLKHSNFWFFSANLRTIFEFSSPSYIFQVLFYSFNSDPDFRAQVRHETGSSLEAFLNASSSWRFLPCADALIMVVGGFGFMWQRVWHIQTGRAKHDYGAILFQRLTLPLSSEHNCHLKGHFSFTNCTTVI